MPSPRPKNVTYIISNIEKALAFEWIAQHLNRATINLSFILLNPGGSALENFLQEAEVPMVRICYRGKSDLWFALRQVQRQLKIWKTDVVHTHLFEANIIGLIAALLVRVPQRILTRHHSVFHHQYFPRAVYYDRFTNMLATHIVAISKMVAQVLVDKEHVSPKKVCLIHHGFDLNIFAYPIPERIEGLKVRYGTKGHYPVIGVIARQTELKGIQYIIPAFADTLKKYPQALLLLANARGDYQATIQQLLDQHLPVASYKQIIFEADLGSFYQLFDVYVHVPIDSDCEAFGQTYIEALAAGIPSVFTLSGVAPEFIKHERNALVVPFQNSVAIAAAIENLLQNSALREKLRENGWQSVAERFELRAYLRALEMLYLT